MPSFDALLNTQLLDNTLTRWGVALTAMTLVAGLLFLGRRLVRRRYALMKATEARELLELPFRVAERTTVPFVVVASIASGATLLHLADGARQVLSTLLVIALWWQAGVWASVAFLSWLERRRERTIAENRAAAGSISVISFIGRTLIWAMVLLLTLDNLGIDITALLAGLGIGGIAVALAVQNVLGDLLASLSIALDKPFVVGDFLIVGEFLGNVEYIGIKSTRLRSLTGEQIVMSNADLLSSRVRNYGRMVERRVVFHLGVTYETPRAKLQRIPELIRAIVEAQPAVRFDRSHFAKYGDFSLDFETVYYVQSANYNQYMDLQQAINFAIHAGFEREGIEFAYPTQKLWLARAEVAAASA